MRRSLVAGNWKMNGTRDGARALASAVARGVPVTADVALCPPYPYLAEVADAVAGSPVILGGQDVSEHAPGAFTGDVAAEMLADLGARMVLVGHSERRHGLGESDARVAAKFRRALDGGLTPVLCVGETLQEREAGRTGDVVARQLDAALGGGAPRAEFVVAYEPVWAIGTGRVATPDQAEEVHADLRRMLESSYNSEVASSVRIQYGGSVKPENAGELLAQPNIDGALVGGASLQKASFLGILAAADGS